MIFHAPILAPSEEGATDWKLDGAVTDSGLMIIGNDGRFHAIMKRDLAPVVPADERLADSLGWPKRALLGTAMTLSLLQRGDGLQLRHTAEHWLSKDTTDSEVVDAMMARINSSFETTDGKLADGLAYLCKVIQKSGNAEYGVRMRELSEAAGHKTLRKYAGLAARFSNN